MRFSQPVINVKRAITVYHPVSTWRFFTGNPLDTFLMRTGTTALLALVMENEEKRESSEKQTTRKMCGYDGCWESF